MFEIYATSWPSAVDANDPRDEFHRTALHEARIATDRGAENISGRATDPVARIQSILAGRQPRGAEPCGCPA